jgi:3-phosphoshikimate 1-carboxyvinyltransferase
MNDRITIQTAGPVRGTIRPPGSKSITNRALVCAALANGQSRLSGALDSEDTQVMIESLGQLGLRVDHQKQKDTIVVDGCGGKLPKDHADLFVANSGTTMRFLTAMVSVGAGQFRLDGIERMRQRPLGDLISAVNQLGGHVSCEQDNDCPPVLIDAKGLSGGRAVIRGNISSQFLSGLLMAAPYAKSRVEILVDAALVSQPYVRMTLEVMSAFGVVVSSPGLQRFVIEAPCAYQSRSYAIEPDASAASYFWAAAAISGGRVSVQGLNRASLQGDVRFCDCLQQMGCEVQWGQQQVTVTGAPLRGIDVDMNDISDTVQTLSAVALFASGPTTIRGVAHIRHKETDRIADLVREIRKLGAHVEEFDDGLKIVPRRLLGCDIDTYNDHRMAMSLALVGLRVPNVVIKDPACTGKTYPRFFDDLRGLIEAS